MMAAAEDRHEGDDQKHGDNQKDDQQPEVDPEQTSARARLILGPIEKLLLLALGARGRRL
jgi:hypothetical protein